ncbi:MAG: substrate-binding domain-containing protein [Nocardioides sp.]|nr:substrate-binding domain-containing protein [Nocardioides sp.]
MRRTTASIGILGVAAALSLTACGSNNSSSPQAGSTSAASVTAACSLDNPPKSGAALPKQVNLGKTSGKVGVILPDTTSSTRYVQYDAPLLTKALKAAGITPDVQNAQGDKNKQASIAQSMIGEGVKVLIIDSIDAASGAGIEKEAQKAGVQVIDYDRVNLGGTAPYYVSFDNEDVGKLQAQTLLDCLKQQGVDSPKIIMMNGGTDVDNNAVLFQKGAHEVFDQNGTDIVAEQTVKGWDVANAAPAFNQALTAAGGQVDGVLAANDDIANAVIGVLKTNGLNGKVAVTGQDSAVLGLQNIVTGQQSMTVFKNVKLEANAAAQLAIALIAGKDPAAAGMQLTKFDDPQSPSHNIQALLLPAQVITQANVDDVVKAGALTTSQICKGIQSDCSKIGLQ